MPERSQSLIIGLIGVIIVIALVWWGSTQRGAQTPAPEVASDDTAAVDVAPITIGWMGPLTGDAAAYGESIKRGVELAQAELGADHISIVFEDSKCEPKDAVSAVNKLIQTDGVPAIIGEVCSGATLAAAPIAEEAQVVMVSTSSTSPDITDAGDFIFRTVPSDALQGTFGAQLASADGHETLAVVYTNEQYGLGFNDVLAEAFPALGGEVVASEAVERTSVDLRAQLTKIKAAAPDAIYMISNSPDTAVAMLKQIEELGIEAALYGSEGFKSDDVLEGAGTAAEGMIVTAVSSGSSEFIASHTETYGETPGPFAAQGYDAFVALANAIAEGVNDGAEIAAALADVQFEGASGLVTFDENGDVAGNYDVLLVSNGEFIPREL